MPASVARHDPRRARREDVKGNVVNPDEVVSAYHNRRWIPRHEMFIGPLTPMRRGALAKGHRHRRFSTASILGRRRKIRDEALLPGCVLNRLPPHGEEGGRISSRWTSIPLSRAS